MSNSNFFKAGPQDSKPPRRQKKTGFVAPKSVEVNWDLVNKSVYVEKKRLGLPGWLIPLTALLLIVALIFWGVPALIVRIQVWMNNGQELNQEQHSLLYDENTWAVNRPVADVFEVADLKADRVTQTLYNEPVQVINKDCGYGFVQVRLADGSEGYMKTDDLVDSRDSIEPDLFQWKLVIVETTKRILSDASQGTLLVEVPMGTVLYADYRGNGISRVILPGGGFGWIGDNGVILMQSTGTIKVDADAKYFCTTALAFNQVTVLPNGQSIYGISTPGIARLAGAVNGLSLPRQIADLAASGQPVELEVDPDTGRYKIDDIKPGDLIFLTDKTGSSPTPVDMAICVKTDQVLYARVGQSVVKLIDLTMDKDLQKRILFVRRLY